MLPVLSVRAVHLSLSVPMLRGLCAMWLLRGGLQICWRLGAQQVKVAEVVAGGRGVAPAIAARATGRGGLSGRGAALRVCAAWSV